MKVFCIDVGNTRTHCAVVEGTHCSNSCDLPTSTFVETFDFESISNFADGISWCSVVPEISKKLSERLGKLNLKSVQLTYKNSPIILDVKNPEQVGQDRIAVAIGASKFFEPPYIVADMGTAVTIDVVDSRGRYAGGAIAPGLHAFVSYLNEKTAQLPLINPKDADYNLVVGKNTLEAMYVGCVKGFCMLADGIISDIEREFFAGDSAQSKTIFTGGSMQLLPKKWLAERLTESNLANIGLACAYEKFIEKETL